MFEHAWRPVLIAVAAALIATAARAQVSTENPASVLVFPKIIADGTRDTFVQVSNAGNTQTNVSCYYVNGQLLNPGLPPGPFNQPLWQVTRFDLTLTQQQPTNWVASQGRPIDSTDPRCTQFPANFDCYGAGTDPGLVPSLAAGFTGELVCVEVDAQGSPISGNHLFGEATIQDLSSGDFSKYSAIGIEGLETNDGDGNLVLGQEYGACPQDWLLDHRAEGTEVPSIGAGSSFRTDIALVPCGQDFADQLPSTVAVQFQLTNEFESLFSVTTSVDCWKNASLDEISGGVFSAIGTLTAQTLIRPSAASGSFLLVAEELRSTGGASPVIAAAAANAYAEGARSSPEVIRVPIP
jgi:hypothetical protein